VNKFNKESKLSEALELKDAAEILTKYNFPCLTCPMMAMEMDQLTIGGICEKYGIDLEKVLEELNAIKK